MTHISCDISSYQPPVDDSYPHRWLIFRDTDPAYAASSPDPTAAHNAAWCRKAMADGRLDGWGTYAVYEPGYNDRIMQYLALIEPLDYVMIDAERWGGVITGDHSPDLNDLANRLAAKCGQSKIWGYANRSDMAELWSNHVPWLPIVIASYGGTEPTTPHVGWQYTNGIWQVPGLPNSSPPFGACDHNLLYPTLTTPEDDLTPIQASQLQQIFDQLGKEANANYALSNQIAPAVGATKAEVDNLVVRVAALGQAVADLTALVKAIPAPGAPAAIDMTAISQAAQTGAAAAVAGKTINLTGSIG
jgi:hypothetical protein